MGIDPFDCPTPSEMGDHHLPLEQGDVTWHHGWLQHGAPPARTQRLAFTASYFMDGALVLPAVELEDVPSYADWLADLECGALAQHAELPLLP